MIGQLGINGVNGNQSSTMQISGIADYLPKEEDKKERQTIDAAALKPLDDSVAQRRAEAQKKAYDIVKRTFDSDLQSDKKLGVLEHQAASLERDIFDNQETQRQISELSDEEERNDGIEQLLIEEWHLMNDRQKLNDKIDAFHAIKDMTNPMQAAREQAENIIASANREIISDTVSDTIKQNDKVFEEEEQKAKEKREQEAEARERIEERRQSQEAAQESMAAMNRVISDDDNLPDGISAPSPSSLSGGGDIESADIQEEVNKQIRKLLDDESLVDVDIVGGMVDEIV